MAGEGVTARLKDKSKPRQGDQPLVKPSPCSSAYRSMKRMNLSHSMALHSMGVKGCGFQLYFG